MEQHIKNIDDVVKMKIFIYLSLMVVGNFIFILMYFTSKSNEFNIHVCIITVSCWSVCTTTLIVIEYTNNKKEKERFKNISPLQLEEEILTQKFFKEKGNYVLLVNNIVKDALNENTDKSKKQFQILENHLNKILDYMKLYKPIEAIKV